MPQLPPPSRAQRFFERRLFLKAMALGLSLPVAYRLVSSARAVDVTRPKRFVLFYMPHGVPPEHYNPVGEGSNFSLTDSGVSVLGPLDPYKAQVNIYEGFKYPGAATHEGIVKFLSNADVGNSDDSTPRTSLEHVIGNGLSQQTLTLGAVPHRFFGQDFDAKVFWDGQAVVPEKNPLVAYEDVFGGLGTGAPANNAADELYQSLLALNESEIEGLQKELSSLTREQSRLQTHLESVRALKSSGGGVISCTSKPTVEALEAIRAEGTAGGDTWFLTEDNFPKILKAQLELAAASVLCNARQVVAIQSLYANCEINFGFAGSGLGQPHHSVLSHTQPQISGGSANMSTRENFAKAQRWFVQMLTTHLIDKLNVDDPADPGRTVLDNTIVLLVSEIGEGAEHTTKTTEIVRGPPPGVMSYMPIVTIGGGGGSLKTGQRLNYYNKSAPEASRDRSAGEVWLTLTRAMGVDAQSFGAATTPVAEALA